MSHPKCFGEKEYASFTSSLYWINHVLPDLIEAKAKIGDFFAFASIKSGKT
jgi:hypothetical protein